MWTTKKLSWNKSPSLIQSIKYSDVDSDKAKQLQRQTQEKIKYWN
jgi:hypothetical protein